MVGIVMDAEEYGLAVRRRVGERIRQLRDGLGWSQDVLAELSGIHRNYIGQIERCAINPGLANLALIARALGVTIGDLTIDVPDPPN